MITGNEKAWIGSSIGIITTAITFILSQLPDTDQLATVRLALVILGGLVGIVGSGLGVYAMTNTPPVAAPASSLAFVEHLPAAVAAPAPAIVASPVPQAPDHL
jgi:hypothetical protein